MIHMGGEKDRVWLNLKICFHFEWNQNETVSWDSTKADNQIALNNNKLIT